MKVGQSPVKEWEEQRPLVAQQLPSPGHLVQPALVEGHIAEVDGLLLGAVNGAQSDAVEVAVAKQRTPEVGGAVGLWPAVYAHEVLVLGIELLLVLGGVLAVRERSELDISVSHTVSRIGSGSLDSHITIIEIYKSKSCTHPNAKVSADRLAIPAYLQIRVSQGYLGQMLFIKLEGFPQMKDCYVVPFVSFVERIDIYVIDSRDYLHGLRASEELRSNGGPYSMRLHRDSVFTEDRQRIMSLGLVWG